MLMYAALGVLAMAANWRCPASRLQAAIVFLLIAGTGLMTPADMSWFVNLAIIDLAAAAVLMFFKAPEYRTIASLILMDALFQLVAGADAYLGTYALWDSYGTVVRITENMTLLACILLAPATTHWIVDLWWRGSHGGRT